MKDWRDIRNGNVIPSNHYCDQPYVVITNDGGWLCCITTGAGAEGATGQHVETMKSFDKGKTWSKPVAVEPDCPLENSYAVMLKTEFGRVYIFYCHNTDDTREILSHDGKTRFTRVDCQGHYVFKYSDDNGSTWSAKRYDIPLRSFQCDLDNVYGGRNRFFWNVGKPFTRNNEAFIPLSKVGKMGDGFYAQSEGALLCSPNILTEKDPERIQFETLPEGMFGLRTPKGGGPVSEEHSYVVLSDSSICVTYRSIDGYPVETYSRDGSRTWEPPYYKRFHDGRTMKHPRAANFMWKCSNGKYLYWFHNHGGHFIRDMWDNPQACSGGCSYYDDRNPAWICAGVEADSPKGRIIRWSEPEILLYDADPFVRMSYPDLIEDGGEYYITETQKNIARSHHINKELLEQMWASIEGKWPGVQPDFVCEKSCTALRIAPLIHRDDAVSERMTGITFTLRFSPESTGTLVEALNDNRYGFQFTMDEDRHLSLSIYDPWTSQILTSPELPADAKAVSVVVDSLACIVSFYADGRFLDGGEGRQFGFVRLNPYLRHFNWAKAWTLDKNVQHLAIFNRALTGVEAIASLYDEA